jgi:hypothetical protein
MRSASPEQNVHWKPLGRLGCTFAGISEGAAKCARSFAASVASSDVGLASTETLMDWRRASLLKETDQRSVERS